MNHPQRTVREELQASSPETPLMMAATVGKLIVGKIRPVPRLVPTPPRTPPLQSTKRLVNCAIGFATCTRAAR